jgi:hypothetical protein
MAAGDAGDTQDPEDEFDRALRELTEGISSGPVIHEPSAAQRAAAAKRAAAATAKAAAKAAAKAKAGPSAGTKGANGPNRVNGPKAGAGASANAGPGRRAKAGPKRSRARAGLGGLIAAWTIVVAVLAGSGVLTWIHFHSQPLRISSPHHLKPVHHTPPPTTSASSATVLINASPFLDTEPPSDPFTGTPADGWADGAAGITVPAAGPHGPFTAAQVRAAYQSTRMILIAGFLDRATLDGGTPARFASLLTSRQRAEFLAGIGLAGRDKQGFPRSTRAWVASFAPGTTRLVTTVVKVHGSMSAGTAVSAGMTVLRVRVNYLFVYAVEPPGRPADWMRVVVQEYGDVDFAAWDDPGRALEPWVRMTPGTAGAQCGMSDGFIHPAYPHGPPAAVRPSGSPVNPYSAAPPAGSSTYRCQLTTGT